MKLGRSAGMLLISIIVVCAVLTISAGSATKSAADTSWGFSLTNLDRSCKPCDDFYEFAMGGWMNAITISATTRNLNNFARATSGTWQKYLSSQATLLIRRLPKQARLWRLRLRSQRLRARALNFATRKRTTTK